MELKRIKLEQERDDRTWMGKYIKAKDILSLAPPTLSPTNAVSSASEQGGVIERPAEPWSRKDRWNCILTPSIRLINMWPAGGLLRDSYKVKRRTEEVTTTVTKTGEQEKNDRWEEKVHEMDSDEECLRRRREKTLITADVIVIVLQEGMKRAQVDGERRDSRASERERKQYFSSLPTWWFPQRTWESHWQEEDLLVAENVSGARCSFIPPF